MTQILPQTNSKTQPEEIQPPGYLNPVVERMGAMHFEGNLIPHTWYQMPQLQMQNGKPNLVAIILLSDIVCWTQSPSDPFDTFHKNYRQWGEEFGFTLRQVEDAMAFLKKSGLVHAERRSVETEYGIQPNCVFIEPNKDLLEALEKNEAAQ
jgi:hypothetical protein